MNTLEGAEGCPFPRDRGGITSGVRQLGGVRSEMKSSEWVLLVRGIRAAGIPDVLLVVGKLAITSHRGKLRQLCKWLPTEWRSQQSTPIARQFLGVINCLI